MPDGVDDMNPMPRNQVAGWLALVALCLVGLAVTLLWLRSHATPSSEAVRLRNALLFDGVFAAADFRWQPADAPDYFVQDSPDEAPEFATELAALAIPADASDETRMLAIAAHLTSLSGRGGAAMSSLRGTYEIIRQGGGYCSDFTAVYLAMAREAGLFAREWAFSFDGFGGRGHAFVEVFDRDRGAWVFMDVYNNFRVTDAESGHALSALDFREHLLGERERMIRVEPVGPGRFGFRNDEAALMYYRAGANQWYLWAGNAVLRYDRHPLVQAFSVSRSLEQLAALTAGVHPRMRVVASAENQAMVENMRALHVKLIVVALTGLILGSVLLRLMWVGIRWTRTRVSVGHAAVTSGGARESVR